MTFLLLLIMAVMIPCENAIVIAGLGTLTRAIGLTAAAAWIAAVLREPRFRRPTPLHVALLFFILWNTTSLFWTFGVNETIQRVITLVQLFGMVWIIWDLTASLAAIQAMLQAYVFGAFVAIFDMVVNYLRGDSLDLRYTGAGLNANDLALVLALALPVAWYLATCRVYGKNTLVLRLTNFAYIPAAVFGISLTASRMGLVAMIPTVFYVLKTSVRLKLSSRILILMALAVGLSALYPYVPQATIERLATTRTSIMTADLGGRGYLWREGVRVFAEHPLLGVGGGAFPVAIQRVHGVAHNTFLSVLIELGIVGFMLFVVVLAITGRSALVQPGRLSGLWLAVLLIWAIGSFTLTWEHAKATWFFLALVTAGSSLITRDQRLTAILQVPARVRNLPTFSSARRRTFTLAHVRALNTGADSACIH